MVDHFFHDHEPGESCADPDHNAALSRRREAKAGTWSPIVRGIDGGGPRDFLDGKAIHCGSALELQAMETRADDYGEFAALLPHGAIVRYEVAWQPPRPGLEGRAAERVIVLYGWIAGHEFRAAHEQWMRFRWPRRGQL